MNEQNRQDILLNAIEQMKAICINMATGGPDFSYEKYESQRGNLLTMSELKTALPDWLVENRYGSSYWVYIKNYAATYAERRDFLRSEFDDLIDFVKSGGSRPASLLIVTRIDNLDSSQLMKHWSKIIERSKDDPEGTITASRALLEATIKKILDIEGVSYSKNDDLPKLYDHFKKKFKLDPASYDLKNIKQLFSGIISVVHGLATLRNDYGDAHGKSEKDFVAEQHHAELAINLSAGLCSFLIDVYTKKKNETQ